MAMERTLMSDEPIGKLTDDILADIISRVPYKSSCCCKCVSTRWRDLFSHPDHRKKLPQPLVGFFHQSYSKNRFPKTVRYFNNASDERAPLVDPSLSFLPRYNNLDIMDSCNGLLLCRCWKVTDTDPKTMDYVVCNPATEKWVVVPATRYSREVEVARLGFEPTVSSHFHVFEFIDEDACGIDESELSDCNGRIEILAIYSSKAGVWKYHSLDRFRFAIPKISKGGFLNGILHLATSYGYIVAVDAEGNDWRLIDVPVPPYFDYAREYAMFVSQRQLYITNKRAGSNGSELSLWALEDYQSKKWTLKHNVSHLELFGLFYESFAFNFNVISFHPERNMVFIVCGEDNLLVSYEMDCKRLGLICQQLGQDCEIQRGNTSYLPYVPLFIDSLADGH